ncbi:aspartate kinase [cyanobacterium endosymbiont of Rhopalodia gibberula]|uniref:aspartate kinase n=1 Tax=cyanobacterium endosymbiont of Rhopalodia gibberula TaxID=1763363 RepID=UPI000DC6E6AA|nr:aspartate kinase [cyanobacterium endosymbiont of Rhopalodia gibberula]BBA79855.1 aspartate kinase [cyanobacterium endosymbiont of Rhopalodia gibberula]
MNLIVQKYGGTSIGSVERVQAVAQRIHRTAQKGNQVVVVVSAMGKTTDTLVKLASEITPAPCRREMDMLLSTGEQVSIALMSMALQQLGQSAISLTGAQVGIITEAEYSRARILSIKPHRIQRHLDRGEVVVVAGFQGISNGTDLEITTLGRGGSDTSAVAIAASLKANCCEIYTDVPGILTTDPRLVSDAQLMNEITCDEMLELASLGAKVLHPRAVEIARNYGIPLVVRSSWSVAPGTRVISPIPKPRSIDGLELTKAVDGIEFDPDQAKVALLRVPDRPGVAARLFGEIANQRVDVDLIIQSIHENNSNDIAFTVVKKVLNKAEAVVEAIAPTLRNSPTNSDEAEVMIEKGTAKIAIVGAGMIGRPGIAAKMFKTLADAQVNIEMIATSEVKVSCVIAPNNGDRAINALCKAFDVKLSKIPVAPKTVKRSLPVRGVALDTKQVQIALLHVQDRPGMAARIFGALADENISVDTIIQSQRCRIVNGMPTRDIAFTVAQEDLQAVQTSLEILSDSFTEMIIDTDIAKVSVVGAGMVGQPGIAAKYFEALAKQKINIKMIATSEIKISCVVAEAEGIQALKAVHKVFGLAGQGILGVSV